jgi:hypothetical protein
LGFFYARNYTTCALGHVLHESIIFLFLFLFVKKIISL